MQNAECRIENLKPRAGLIVLLMLLTALPVAAFRQQYPSVDAGSAIQSGGTYRAAGTVSAPAGPGPLSNATHRAYSGFRGLDFDRRGPTATTSVLSADTSRVIFSQSSADDFPADLPGWGIWRNDGQYNLDGGTWTDWFTARIASSDTFGPTNPITMPSEAVIGFRVRGTDKAWNSGPWSEPIYQSVSRSGRLSLAVASPYGTPVPAVGVTWYTSGTAVHAEVDSSVVVGGRTKVCVGWSGTGSVPLTGSIRQVDFNITANSTLTWRWADAESLLFLDIVSAFGAPLPPVGRTVYFMPTLVDASVESLVTVGAEVWRCTGYTGTGSVGSGTGNHVAFTIAVNSSLTWNWVRADSFVALTVLSTYDSPSPSGTTFYRAGTLVTASVAATVPVDSTRRWACSGWAVTGSGNPTGDGNLAQFTIASSCTLRWNWGREYLIVLAYDAPGGHVPVQGGTGWAAVGTRHAITSEPFYTIGATDYSFANWTSEPAGAQLFPATSAGTEVLADTAYVMTAHYVSGAVPCAVRKSPLQSFGDLVIDGVVYSGTGLVNVLWLPGSQHRVSATSPDLSGDGRRWQFTRWSDGDTTRVDHIYTLGPDTATVWAYYDLMLACTLRVAPSHRNPHLTFGTVTQPDTDRVVIWAKADSAYALSVTALVPLGGTAYRFVNWSDGPTTSSRTSGPITAPTTFVANFRQEVRLTQIKSPSHTTGFIYLWGDPQTGSSTRSEYVPANQAVSIGVSTEDPKGADSVWIWDAWSDGGTPLHSVVPAGETTLVATYHGAPLILAFDLDPATWTLTNVPTETTCVTSASEGFTLTNTGNVTGRVGLQNIAETGMTWVPDHLTGYQRYYLGARMDDNAVPPAAGGFAAWLDVIPRSYVGWAGVGNYGGGGIIPAVNPAIPGRDPTERLWLEFKSPTVFGDEGNETIRVRVSFEAVVP